MSVPRFFSRVLDSISPLIGSEGEVQAFLADTVIELRAPSSLARHRAHLEGFMLAANLCARLYPRIRIKASRNVVAQISELVRRINPAAIVDGPGGERVTAALAWGEPAGEENAIAVSASGWEVLLGGPDAERLHRTNVLTALAGAALGVGELFRLVFRPLLPRGEPSSHGVRFNVINGEIGGSAEIPSLPPEVCLGDVVLVGAGAIGQGFVYALARTKGIHGVLHVYDPEHVTLSNLQRYVLTGDADDHASKCDLVLRELGAGRLVARVHETAWEERSEDHDRVCLAVDDAATRIAVQASLPLALYNAWTQPADLGWSRHESFGVDPCVGCLYWPVTRRPSYHELIADALKQHPLRVLGYLTFRKPIGEPLGANEVPELAELPKPAEWEEWLGQSILDDIARTFAMAETSTDAWRSQRLSDLYHEGVCGGALLRHADTGVGGDIAVPLAHQSVLAGVMLAIELVTACTAELREYRPKAIEGRVDVLRPLPQAVSRPRQRTEGCLCGDSDFKERYEEKWGEPLTESTPSAES